MLIDLHCHTRVHSACSALTPDALVRAAVAAGLHGVCITEHDALWTLDDVERLSHEMGFLVLRGMEVTTEVGHVLVFGAVSHKPGMASVTELQRLARADGALLYLAHPGRAYGTLPADLGALFDSVESKNGTEGALQNEQAGRLAASMPLPGIGGSDAHSVREVGTCATRFERDVRDEASFLAALRAGAYAAHQLRR